MRRFTAYGPAFVVLVTTLVTLFAAPAAVRQIGYASSEAQIRLARTSLESDDILERLNTATRNIAAAVEPSVVHIAIEASEARGRGPGMRISQGSGWLYDAQGHIVTNAHVIRDAPTIVVQFHDGRTLPAAVLGIDDSTDIAVLKVGTAEGLFPAARATGVEVRQGDRVYAFGSPFGFKFSMSEGIVSGLGRDPRAVINAPGGGYTNFIQTDAAVNPGNSGGPLVDIKGRVVAMNVAIATAGNTRDGEGQNSGISFAIPLETIENVVDQLINGGAVARGFLGIRMPGPSDGSDISERTNRELMEKVGYSGRGVYITDVEAGGPAEAAGLRAGDIITQFNGKHVQSITGLRSSITVNRPGERTRVTVWRDGKTVDLSVVLASLATAEPGLRSADFAAGNFGLRWEPAAPPGRGVAVAEVEPRSEAAAAGFRPGQVIVQVGGSDVESEQDFLAQLAQSGFPNGRGLTVTVREADGTMRDVSMRLRP